MLFFQRSILRAVHPHRLTAGKFLAINFISFKEIRKIYANVGTENFRKEDIFIFNRVILL